MPDREGICLISDRHKGILSAVNEGDVGFKEPQGYHRYCLRHVESNFNAKFKDAYLKKLVWSAGSSHQIRKFNGFMEDIKKINRRAWEYLENIPVEKWTIAHDGGRRYGMRTTNISEVFNGVLKGARNLPITACVENIFFRVVYYFTTRREIAEGAIREGFTLTPTAIRHLLYSQGKIGGYNLDIFHSGNGYVQVLKRGLLGSSQIVNISYGTCSCGK